MESEAFRAMNSEILLMAEGDPHQAISGFREARSFIEASEQRFTRFSGESELSALNRSAGRWFNASPELLAVVREALLYFRKTKGLFDPSILPDLQRAGYTRSMDEIRRDGVEQPPVAHAHRQNSSFEAVEIDPANSAIRLPAGMSIDLGGIAKGWIAEQAARVLSRSAEVCAVNAGGDMFMIGCPSGQEYWEVGLEDPREPTLDLAVLQVGEGAVATSSVAKRVWRQGEAKRHHLIDPRTGEPAETPWLSVTVIAEHSAEAETFAKAFLMAGEDQACRLIEENPQLTVLAVDRAGQMINLNPRERANANQ